MAASVDEQIALMRRGYDAFSRGDMDSLRQTWTEDIVWHAGGRNRLSGEKRGADAVIAYFGQVIEASGGTFRVELHDVVANEGHVVSLHTATAERDGRRISVHGVLVAHARDGKLAEIWEHADDSRALDELIG